MGKRAAAEQDSVRTIKPIRLQKGHGSRPRFRPEVGWRRLTIGRFHQHGCFSRFDNSIGGFIGEMGGRRPPRFDFTGFSKTAGMAEGCAKNDQNKPNHTPSPSVETNAKKDTPCYFTSGHPRRPPEV